MTGKLYGVGVGPGDPELLTLKAVRIIKENEIIALPGAVAKDTVAYQIAVQAVPELKEKELVSLAMPMTKDKKMLESNYAQAADTIEAYLRAGKNVVFLTLGDPTIYATYFYLHERILKRGLEAEMISGIPSFCAVAARLDMSLAERAEELHIIPASYQIKEALALPGTKVLMKAGKNMSAVKAQLQTSGAAAVMIENCGRPGERIYQTAAEIPDQAGYYSLVIVKEK